MVKGAFGESLIEWDQSLRDAVGTRNHGDFPRSVKLRTRNQTGMESPSLPKRMFYISFLILSSRPCYTRAGHTRVSGFHGDLRQKVLQAAFSSILNAMIFRSKA